MKPAKSQAARPPRGSGWPGSMPSMGQRDNGRVGLAFPEVVNPHPFSKFRMSPYRKHRNRSAVMVISRIVEQLVVEGQHGPLVEVIGVISLKNIFTPIVETAVADQYADTAGFEI